MEDWLYAAGWDKGPLRSCIGDTTSNKRTLAHGRRLFTPASSGAANDYTAGSRIDVGQQNSSVANTTSSAPRRQLNQHEHIGENRAVVFLVETSDRKKPADSTLGGTLNVSEGACWCHFKIRIIVIFFHLSFPPGYMFNSLVCSINLRLRRSAAASRLLSS